MCQLIQIDYKEDTDIKHFVGNHQGSEDTNLDKAQNCVAKGFLRCPLRYLGIRPKRLLFVFTVLMFANYTNGFCPSSLNTMETVKNCPKSKEEWNQRAMLKDCSKFHQSCTDNSTFLYHCLPNTNLQTLVEVCAPMIYASEYCCEFNSLGAVVQRNYKADCRNYSHPCLKSFPSTESFRYQECYAKNSQVAVEVDDGVDKSKKDRSGIGFGIVIPLGFLAFFSILMITGLIYILKRRRDHSKDKQQSTNSYVGVKMVIIVSL
ncbi:uncharacterized protein LOC134246517 [Saccostrea cucullata]|uniref:uncharacterized protein LOC134246517 n=1 Tax=Saccostrea cuccullata TaxID=36930 RepID=UPI002ED3630D